MVSAEEALSSDVPATVRKLRGAIKVQIICDIKLLEKELAKRKDEELDLASISHELMKLQKKKLIAHFDLIQKLHDKYLEIREEGISTEAEEKLLLEDVNYMEEITSKVCPVLDAIGHYEDVLANTEKMKGVSDDFETSCELIQKYKKEFQLVHNKITSELSKFDTISDTEERSAFVQSLPTVSLLENITTIFNDMKTAHSKLSSTLKALNKNDEEMKINYGIEEQHAQYLDIEMKLKTYEQKKSKPRHSTVLGDPATTFL